MNKFRLNKKTYLFLYFIGLFSIESNSFSSSLNNKRKYDLCDENEKDGFIKKVKPNSSIEDLNTEEFRKFEQEANQGYPEAQFKLGWMYEEGQGVNQSNIEAVKWYRQAAGQDYPEAQLKLGWMYEEGQGVNQSNIEATKWYRQAADQGYPEAQFKLGWMYEEGQGVNQNSIEAAKWYRQAADQGHAKSQFILGWMYTKGQGVARNDIEAAKWYRQAADQGHLEAQLNLGWMYEEGQGVARNDIEAAKWYRQAADQGHSEAQFKLGWKYDEGLGVDQSNAEATKWYLKSAKQDNTNAKNMLKYILNAQISTNNTSINIQKIKDDFFENIQKIDKVIFELSEQCALNEGLSNILIVQNNCISTELYKDYSTISKALKDLPKIYLQLMNPGFMMTNISMNENFFYKDIDDIELISIISVKLVNIDNEIFTSIGKKNVQITLMVKKFLQFFRSLEIKDIISNHIKSRDIIIPNILSKLIETQIKSNNVYNDEGFSKEITNLNNNYKEQREQLEIFRKLQQLDKYIINIIKITSLDRNKAYEIKCPWLF